MLCSVWCLGGRSSGSVEEDSPDAAESTSRKGPQWHPHHAQVQALTAIIPKTDLMTNPRTDPAMSTGEALFCMYNVYRTNTWSHPALMLVASCSMSQEIMCRFSINMATTRRCLSPLCKLRYSARPERMDCSDLAYCSQMFVPGISSSEN